MSRSLLVGPGPWKDALWLLAAIVLANWSFGLWEALLLLGLFTTQLLIPVPWIRVGFSILYVLITAGYLAAKSYRTSFFGLLLNGWRTDSSSG